MLLYVWPDQHPLTMKHCILQHITPKSYTHWEHCFNWLGKVTSTSQDAIDLSGLTPPMQCGNIVFCLLTEPRKVSSIERGISGSCMWNFNYIYWLVRAQALMQACSIDIYLVPTPPLSNIFITLPMTSKTYRTTHCTSYNSLRHPRAFPASTFTLTSLSI